jgi:diguanylate cyclase (GGDEF)-like protein/PAS domain S-box-containing protein
MSQTDKSKEKLSTEIALLRQELADLKREKADLEVVLKTTTDHADYVENDLLNKIESTVRESEKQFRLISETIPIPIFVTRVADSTIVYANKPAGAFFGLPLDQLVGCTMTEFYEPTSRQALVSTITAGKQISNYELQGTRTDGRVFWAALSTQLLIFNNESCLFGALVDLSGRREMEEKLRKHQNELESLVADRTVELTKANEKLTNVNLRLREILRRESIQDPLTNLYSRRYMERSLERELSRCKRHELPLTVIMADIDHFRTFNDTYGHAAGDVVLQKLGRSLKTKIRQEDIVCRYDGGEFALILSQAPLKNVKQRAEQIRLEVKKDLNTSSYQNDMEITISMGLAEFPAHGTNSKEILSAADIALYQAKREGRDRVEIATNAS